MAVMDWIEAVRNGEAGNGSSGRIGTDGNGEEGCGIEGQ